MHNKHLFKSPVAKYFLLHQKVPISCMTELSILQREWLFASITWVRDCEAHANMQMSLHTTVVIGFHVGFKMRLNSSICSKEKAGWARSASLRASPSARTRSWTNITMILEAWIIWGNWKLQWVLPIEELCP